MSKEARLFGSLPRGWKVEQPDHDPDYQGSVCVLRRPDKATLRLARRNLRELAEGNVEGQGKYLLDRTSGESWEVIVTAVDLHDTKASGAEAFVVRDGWFVPLRPPGWRHEGDTSQLQGEVYGREARPDDPMPVPADMRIF